MLLSTETVVNQSRKFSYYKKVNLFSQKTNRLKISDERSPPYVKENFILSRRCGTTESKCPASECSSCSDIGYTTEKSYYRQKVAI